MERPPADGAPTRLRSLSAELPPLIFLSADDRLLGAATGEGLPVDHSNRHP
jgi:hypothetical protein